MKFMTINRRGDTLIEVTLALAILSSVVVSSYVVANRSILYGRNSNERSQLVNAVQEQAEALRSFRDSHTWDEFQMGDTHNPQAYYGVSEIVDKHTIDCWSPHGVWCFHMVKTPTGWFPQDGPGCDTRGGTQYWCTINRNDTYVDPVIQTFTFRYGSGTPGNIGNGFNDSTIVLQLSNLDGLLK